MRAQFLYVQHTHTHTQYYYYYYYMLCFALLYTRDERVNVRKSARSQETAPRLNSRQISFMCMFFPCSLLAK